jgi:tetratricopeptide (TPR) repeat protein
LKVTSGELVHPRLVRKRLLLTTLLLDGLVADQVERAIRRRRQRKTHGYDQFVESCRGVPVPGVVVRKRGGRNLNNHRYVFINMDDHPNPMTELRRLLNIQLMINHAGRAVRSLGDNNVRESLAAAEKAAYCAPNNPDTHLNLSFIAYLAGEPEKSLQAFRRAKQLAPDFQRAWEAMAARPAYKKITEDRQFVDKTLKEPRP